MSLHKDRGHSSSDGGGGGGTSVCLQFSMVWAAVDIAHSAAAAGDLTERA